MRNPSRKTMKHMAKRALFQMDPYNPIIAQERFIKDLDWFIEIVDNYPSPRFTLPGFLKEDSK